MGAKRRLSGLQSQVLTLYRNVIRAAREKEPAVRTQVEGFARQQFHLHAKQPAACAQLSRDPIAACRLIARTICTLSTFCGGATSSWSNCDSHTLTLSMWLAATSRARSNVRSSKTIRCAALMCFTLCMGYHFEVGDGKHSNAGKSSAVSSSGLAIAGAIAIAIAGLCLGFYGGLVSKRALLDETDTSDVRQHCSTFTRYSAAVAAQNKTALPPVPATCSPVHINLVARHGTRYPTLKKLRAIQVLAKELQAQTQGLDSVSSKFPEWLKEWHSPWENVTWLAGQLHQHGEEEMHDIGFRWRERYPQLLKIAYNPLTHMLRASQVSRASASATAFGLGLYEGQGTLGPGRHRAFAVSSESKNVDRRLRFHKNCPAYQAVKEKVTSQLKPARQRVLAAVGDRLAARYDLQLKPDNVDALWMLCKTEAALQDVTDRACGLFTKEEILALEFQDDVETYRLKAYGTPLNYQMAALLVDDLATAAQVAAMAHARTTEALPGVERARIQIAHAEVLLPLTCALGLFREDPEHNVYGSDAPHDCPCHVVHADCKDHCSCSPEQMCFKALRDMPDVLSPEGQAAIAQRKFRGALVSPFAGNVALVLYRCAAEDGSEARFILRAFHNEQPVEIPACGGPDCDLQFFLDEIAAPYMNQDFDTLCAMPATTSQAIVTESVA
eukprot:jgi/Chlat1/4495/Chrsp29S04429